jgi:hypothetical protein
MGVVTLTILPERRFSASRLSFFLAVRDLSGLELRQRPNVRISHREPNTRDGGLAVCWRFLLQVLCLCCKWRFLFFILVVECCTLDGDVPRPGGLPRRSPQLTAFALN